MIEILDVSVTPDRTRLHGSDLDGPSPGRVFDDLTLPITGWVLGRSDQVAAVQVAHEGRVVRLCPLGRSRPDVALAFSNVPGAVASGFKAHVNARELPLEFELHVAALLANGDQAEIASIRAHRQDSGQHDEEQPKLGSLTPNVPTIKHHLEKLILEAMTAYRKEAGDELATPGEVSSVADSSTEERSDERARVLERLGCEGKRVLVLGIGFGGVSRMARARGAALVDSFDPDPQRVTLARLLNAYHQVARVSFYQREIANEDAYSEHYDLVLAFSSPDPIRQTLGRIAEITDGVFVTELPEGSNEASMLASIRACFPFHETWEMSPDVAPNRAATRYLVASKTETHLRAAPAPEGAVLARIENSA